MKLLFIFYALCVLAIAQGNPSANLDSAAGVETEQVDDLGRQDGRGLKQARVVNGWDALPGQFGFATYLEMQQNCKTRGIPDSRLTTICTSSLIMPRVLVSAGHCLYKCSSGAAPDSLPGEFSTVYNEKVTWGGPITAKINQLDISKSTSTVRGAEQKIIAGAIRNPDYRVRGNLPVENDISLMWFDKPSAVDPVKLAVKSTFPSKQKFMVAGWGYTEPDDSSSLSDVLKTAVVPYVSIPDCSTVYGNQVWGGNICAGSDPANFADTCSGDSGGPLLINTTEPTANGGVEWTQRLAGVTSYGESCANKYPGVYTNVPFQSGWIDESIILNNAGGLEPPRIGCSSHAGHRYTGSKFTTFKSIANAGQCCNACKVNGTTCRSWSWHRQSKNCLLFQKFDKRVISEGWTSGNVTGTLPKKVNSCELEFYVQYSDPARTQLVGKYTGGPAVTSPTACCNACRKNPNCWAMTYNEKKRTCDLYKGPSPTKGWSRKAWQYDYVSGLVTRR